MTAWAQGFPINAAADIDTASLPDGADTRRFQAALAGARAIVAADVLGEPPFYISVEGLEDGAVSVTVHQGIPTVDVADDELAEYETGAGWYEIDGEKHHGKAAAREALATREQEGTPVGQ